MPIKPIRPSEIAPAALPDFVVETFNQLISKAWNGSSARITQEEAVRALLASASKPEGLTRNGIFEKKLLDVEPAYRKEGWKVAFDKPAYCEDYEAFWVFKKR